MRELKINKDIFYKGKKYFVSTVDLFGINHGTDEEPLYFETMIFAYNEGEVDYCDLYLERYETKEEAIKRHNEIIDFDNVDIELWEEINEKLGD